MFTMQVRLLFPRQIKVLNGFASIFLVFFFKNHDIFNFHFLEIPPR